MEEYRSLENTLGPRAKLAHTTAERSGETKGIAVAKHETNMPLGSLKTSYIHKA